MSEQATAVHDAATVQLSQRSDLLDLADRTLAEYLRYLAAFGGAIAEEDGLLLFAGAHRQPNPYRNGALRLSSELEPRQAIRLADGFFAQRRSGYALWAREHGDADLEQTAQQAGLHELERLPELFLERLPDYLPPPEGVEIRRAQSSRAREDYLGLVADAWGMASMPRAVAAKVFFDPDSLDVPNVAAFVAYYEDEPLSAAMTHVTHGVALGCQAATLRRPKPGQRLPRSGAPGERRGLAQSCLWAALELSYRELGARLSLCQTSGLGAPVWLGLGYRPFTNYARYLMPVRQPGAPTSTA
ncbi:MAG TPA: hypothetical protein VHU13_09105 [Solirubrobacteraceae bacterium]|jgi:hypothetical protein|nr:hypothetical protein [Solirubrobacteraceae bacterium]